MTFGKMTLKRNDRAAAESAARAQRDAHVIAAGAIVFQVARVMAKLGIFSFLSSPGGHTEEEAAEYAGISRYGAKVLLEASLTAGTVSVKDGRYTLTKTGWFLINDPMVKVNLDFNHDVNYKGFWWLEDAIRNGRPEGLRELGGWPTIYEGHPLNRRPGKAGSRSTISIRIHHSRKSSRQCLPQRRAGFLT